MTAFDPFEELLADTRARCRASDREEAQAIAELPDQDILWLLANQWQPPGPVLEPERRRSAGSGAFVLTVGEFRAYQDAVDQARRIKDQLELAERKRLGGEDERWPAELRLLLQEKAAQVQAMAEGWKQEP